jgi:Flavoprotein
MLDKVKIATELEHRMLPDWVVRCEEGTEIQTRHEVTPGFLDFCLRQTTGNRLSREAWAAWAPRATEGMARAGGDEMPRETFDVAYLLISGTTTAARAPALLRGLRDLGFSSVIAIPSPNASRVISGRELADVDGTRVVESYFDLGIRPRPPRGVVLFAPCGFNSVNKLAAGIADNLPLSVAAEAIGRGTPVIVGPSLNQPLMDHPATRASFATLSAWGVVVVPPVDEGDGPRLAPSDRLLDAVRPFVRRERADP